MGKNGDRQSRNTDRQSVFTGRNWEQSDGTVTNVQGCRRREIEMKARYNPHTCYWFLPFFSCPLLLNLRPIKFTLTCATSVMWHLSTPSTLPWDAGIISAKLSGERDFIPPLTDRERQKQGEGGEVGGGGSRLPKDNDIHNELAVKNVFFFPLLPLVTVPQLARLLNHLRVAFALAQYRIKWTVLQYVHL